MNQQFPWRGKLATRAAIAEEEVNAARARLAAVELKVVEQIKNAYFQLFFVQQATSIIEADRQQLEFIRRLVKESYQVGQVTQQDLLQVDVAISQIETQLLRFHAEAQSARARLARLLHVSPETRFETIDSLPTEQMIDDIDQLYDLAIACRPELHAQLATIKRDRKTACLAELNNYPDLSLGFNWIATSSDGISPIANGEDSFLLTLGMNLPIYRKKIDAGIREAQTRALANARKYDRLKDETMESVAELYARINSLHETLKLFRNDIIPKQELTLNQSLNDYRVNEVDSLQVMENWRQLLQFHLTEKRLEADLQKSLASMARQIGDFEVPANIAPAEPATESSPNREGEQPNSPADAS